MMRKCSLPLAGIIGALLIYMSVNGLIVEGIFNWHVQQSAFRSMLLELIVFGILLLAVLWPKWVPVIKAVGSGLILAIFLAMHTMLVPILVALLYIGYILLFGNTLRIFVFRLQTGVNLLVDFLLGCCGLVAFFCILSIFKIGGTTKLWIAMMILAMPLLILGILRINICRKRWLKTFSKAFTLNQQQGFYIWGMLLFFMIQAGRLNNSIDYDSIWYGMRGTFILDNGNGIFENLGAVGLVYSYSKGLEVLTLPLAGLPSYSFLISFNLLMIGFVLYGCYHLLNLFMAKSQSLMICLWIVSIPGIMNMGNTAKSDMLTLAVQVMLIVFQTYYIYEEKTIYFILSISALLFSWTLKPTALVFSTAIFGMFCIYVLMKRQLWLKDSFRRWLVVVPAVFCWLALWIRTLLLTGVPVTSVFSGILTKIGFKMKYPYGSNGVTNYTPNLFSKEGLTYLVDRLYGFFINPSSERMNHVIIAWGTVLIPFAMLLIFVAVFQSKSISYGTKRLKHYLFFIFIPFIGVNMISMLMLYQPDGNYFMLFYVILLLLAGICTYHIRRPVTRQLLHLMVIPFLIANIIFTSLNNWSWTLGFSERSFTQLYVNHQKANQEKMVREGNQKIWDILAEDARTRVIGIGYHPDVLVFPCNIQSYYDLWNWCNEDIVHSVTNFKEFMVYAETDYIYIQRNFIEKNSPYSRMVSKLILDGVLTELIFEEGNILARVAIDAPMVEEGRSNYNQFFEEYQFFQTEAL